MTVTRSADVPELDNRKSTWFQIDRGWVAAEFLFQPACLRSRNSNSKFSTNTPATRLTLQSAGAFKIESDVIEDLSMAIQLHVPNMACSACSDTITQAVKVIDPAATVQADTKTKLVMIDTQASETAIRHAITTAGYTVAD